MSKYEKMINLPGVEGVRARFCHYGAVSRDRDIPTLLTEIDRLKKLLGKKN